MTQYSYVMKGVTKIFPGGQTVFKDIWLSFLPGAKIGVIGPNGAGKSTLFKLMAGLDKDFIGEAWAADGVNVGYLPQEPALNDDLDVMGNIRAGLSEISQALERFEALSLQLAEPMSDEEMTKLILKCAIKSNKGYIYFNEMLYRCMRRKYGNMLMNTKMQSFELKTQFQIFLKTKLMEDKTTKVDNSEIYNSLVKKEVQVNPFLTKMFQRISFRTWVRSAR